MGWRDICRSTDERTLISAVFPISGTDDTLSVMLPIVVKAAYAAALLACMNSLTLDFVAQQKVGGTHIRKFILSQFPVPPPSAFGEVELSFITPRVLELTYTSPSMGPWAKDLGYNGPPSRWDEDRRAILRAELDAYIARLYGLSRNQLRYILDPKDSMGADYPSETFRGLQENEHRKYGEYRTARLVLEAWDRLERGEV